MSQHIKFRAFRLAGYVRSSLALGAAFAAVASSGTWAQSSDPVDTTKIVIGQSASGPAEIPLYVALQQDFFKKAGLDVTSQHLSGGTPSTMASFVSGAVNMLNSSAPELIQYTGKKVLSGKAFGEVIDHQYDIVVAKGITNIQDLKGKTVGVSAINAADYIYIVAVLEHYGLSRNDVTFITSGTPVNRIAALGSGVIQVMAQGNPQRGESLKVGDILLKSSDSPIQFPNNMFIANDDLIKNHKPLLKKFLGAMHDALDWMRANPDATVDVCVKSLGATAQACAGFIKLSFDKSMTSKYTWSSTFAINVEGVKSALAVMAAIEPDTRNLTIDDVVDTSIAGTTP